MRPIIFELKLLPSDVLLIDEYNAIDRVNGVDVVDEIALAQVGGDFAIGGGLFEDASTGRGCGSSLLPLTHDAS